jgi:butyrate kinase
MNTTIDLNFIAKQQERILNEMAALRVSHEETNRRLAAIEKSQDRFRVRQAIMETRQNDLTGDLAAIARVVERAGLLEDE